MWGRPFDQDQENEQSRPARKPSQPSGPEPISHWSRLALGDRPPAVTPTGVQVQAKSDAPAPSDPLEDEADAAADAVTAREAPESSESSEDPGVVKKKGPFPGLHGSINEVRTLLRDEFFIEATVNAAMGGQGQTSEFISAIVRTSFNGQAYYFNTPPEPGDEYEVNFAPLRMKLKGLQTLSDILGQEEVPATTVVEIVHSHPSGIRAAAEKRPEELSGPDKQLVDDGDAESIGLVTPSGGYIAYGQHSGGRESEILPRGERNRLGRREDYVPDRADLMDELRRRIDDRIASMRRDLEQRILESKGVRRALAQRKLDRLPKVREKAIRRLERKARKGEL